MHTHIHLCRYPLYMDSMQNWHFWRSEESSIWCHILTICGPLTTHTPIFDHSFHCIYATCNNQDGHKSRCSELISGTKALQFVTFWKFLSLTENTGEHWSKGIDRINGVQNWWSEWSQTTIFHSWILSFSAWYWPLYMAIMQNWHFWRSEKSSI